RLHGFIPGWVLFRFTEDLKLKGYGLNTEYFSEVLHQLRHQTFYAQIVQDALDIPKNADTRDTRAVIKICTALLKLLFPHVNSLDDISLDDFDNLILKPAMRYRAIIRQQLAVLDSEFSSEMPNIRLAKERFVCK
ncbi:MAG TPA: BREX system Lon protease-like protein BrxL, partial [Candidatus Cloacimonadota bacterium]|nr:BREX system Lon protease-like protein BrxL [Candidatus Cloacimonadota bacterium]